MPLLKRLFPAPHSIEELDPKSVGAFIYPIRYFFYPIRYRHTILGFILPPLFFLIATDDSIDLKNLGFMCLLGYALIFLMIWAFIPRAITLPIWRRIRYALLIPSGIGVIWFLYILLQEHIPILRMKSSGIEGSFCWLLFLTTPIIATTLFLVPWAKTSEATIKAFALALRISTLALIIAIFGVAGIVAAQAERIAQNRPYCVQIPYQEVWTTYHAPSWFDLTALRMRGYSPVNEHGAS